MSLETRYRVVIKASEKVIDFIGGENLTKVILILIKIKKID